jgi:hypothetical protein
MPYEPTTLIRGHWPPRWATPRDARDATLLVLMEKKAPYEYEALAYRNSLATL